MVTNDNKWKLRYILMLCHIKKVKRSKWTDHPKSENMKIETKIKKEVNRKSILLIVELFMETKWLVIIIISLINSCLLSAQEIKNDVSIFAGSYFEMISNSSFNKELTKYNFKENNDAIEKFIIGVNIDFSNRIRGIYTLGYGNNKNVNSDNVSQYSVISFSGLAGYDLIKNNKFAIIPSIGYEYSKYNYSLYSGTGNDFHTDYGYWESQAEFNSLITSIEFDYNFKIYKYKFYVGLEFDYNFDIWTNEWSNELNSTYPFTKRGLGTGIRVGYIF